MNKITNYTCDYNKENVLINRSAVIYTLMYIYFMSHNVQNNPMP